MSQKVTRKAVVNEDKEKNKAESPVKDMKKKMAANAEKEKHAEEKADKAEKTSEKAGEKSTEKSDKSQKPDKSADKKSEKLDKSVDKKSEKKDNVEKKSDKPEPQAEKSKAESSKEEKSKPDKEKPEPKKAEQPKNKQNSKDRVHNGVSDVTLGNGTNDALNGTVSADSEDDDVMLVIDDHDDLFPELKYDDTSDMECSEPPTPENAPSRSLTRRSQVKATRTPETPRPASDKQTDSAEDPKDGSKLLKLKDEVPTTDRKLRSSDATKPQESKKQDAEKKQDSEKRTETDKKQDDKQQEADSDAKNKNDKIIEGQEKEAESKDVVGEKNSEDNKSQERNIEIEVVVDVETNDGEGEVEGEETQRKTDTNYSKSRVKVSPYRRSMRLADQTNTSVLANYTGNNTTMEMDITESSSIIEDANLDDSSYLRGLRSIRGRSSYKPLKEMAFKHISNKSIRSSNSVNISSSTEINRPTGTVVGRKRKPDFGSVELATEATSDLCGDTVPLAGSSKRMRVLERLAEPFRRVASVSLPSVSRRNADIVGINTDLPLSAPVVTDAFDPESLKTTVQSEPPIAVPLSTREQDNKRCILM